jgi:hypothetical protein
VKVELIKDEDDLWEGTVLQDVSALGNDYYLGLWCSSGGSYWVTVTKDNCKIITEETT